MKKTIKFIYEVDNQCCYKVAGDKELENLTLIQILKKLEFDENDNIEIYYVEDCEKIDKLNRILEVIEEV